MASNKALSSTALFLSLNLLFFSMLSSASHSRHPPPPPPTSTTPPPPTSTTPPPPLPTCRINILNLSVCVNLLGGVIGSPSTSPCCSLIQGLVDLEAAVCLCTAIRANVLGIILNVDVALSLLLNVCGKRVPSGFQCR